MYMYISFNSIFIWYDVADEKANNFKMSRKKMKIKKKNKNKKKERIIKNKSRREKKN